MAEEAVLCARELSPSFDVLDAIDTPPLNRSKMSALDKLLDEEALGKRSASPPGRQDWRAGERAREDPSEPNHRLARERSRSRSRSGSRSPGRVRKRVPSRERQRRYEMDGSNTTREEPHLQRARLFVGNIEPSRVHRRDLIRLFSEFGDVLGVSVHKGYAFVQMDRERSANKAINYLDGRMYMGNPIHVEFSQAALKAGARLERLPRHLSPTPPVRERAPDPYAMRQLEIDQEILREREERLSRILQMEKELSLLRNRDEMYESMSRRSRYDSAMDRAAISEHFQRASPPPMARDYPPSYSLGGHEERRNPYSRQTERGMDRPFEGPPSPVHREPVSYPQLGAGRLSSSSNSLERGRDGFSSQYGGSSSYGFSQRTSSGGSLANVGYGSSSMSHGGESRVGRGLDSGKPMGLSGGPPPGWPSGGYKDMNRPPFTGNSRWS